MKQIIPTLFISLIFGATAFGQESLKTAFDSGSAYARTGNFEKALADFQTAFNLADAADVSLETRAQLHFNIAVCNYRLGRSSLAVGEFTAAIARRPRYEKAFYALGMAEAERRNWSSAQTAFQAAIDINRKNAEAWFDLGYVYLAIKDLDAAKTAFEQAAKYKSVDSAVSHNNIGVILAAYGDTRRAIAEFELALRLSANELETAARNLAICRRQEIIAGKLVAANLEFGRPARYFGN